MIYKTITFYKYILIEDTLSLMEDLQSFCELNNLKGRILLGTEGINAGVSGSSQSITAFKSFILANPLFADLTFREQIVERISYTKLVVRVRDEVVAFEKDVDLKNKGKHISPAALKSLLDNNKEVVLLDARNEYEYKLGKFKNAITLPIENFSEFPDVISNIQHLKQKKIVMYCTGGIRCEKSSAYLREQGFKDVSQLQGGIINFVNQFPDSYYEGSCFVFDDRIVASVSKQPLNTCSFCDTKTDAYINCHNMDCDKLFIACSSCQKSMQGTCSNSCKLAPRQRPEKNRQIRITSNNDYA